MDKYQVQGNEGSCREQHVPPVQVQRGEHEIGATPVNVKFGLDDVEKFFGKTLPAVSGKAGA